jgi:hypothetical protein
MPKSLEREAREKVYAALESEDEYAYERWRREAAAQGLPYNPNQHEIMSWLGFANYHLQEAMGIATVSMPETKALDHARKAANLLVRCMMQHGAPMRDVAGDIEKKFGCG